MDGTDSTWYRCHICGDDVLVVDPHCWRCDPPLIIAVYRWLHRRFTKSDSKEH